MTNCLVTRNTRAAVIISRYLTWQNPFSATGGTRYWLELTGATGGPAAYWITAPGNATPKGYSNGINQTDYQFAFYLTDTAQAQKPEPATGSLLGLACLGCSARMPPTKYTTRSRSMKLNLARASRGCVRYFATQVQDVGEGAGGLQRSRLLSWIPQDTTYVPTYSFRCGSDGAAPPRSISLGTVALHARDKGYHRGESGSYRRVETGP